ncbi:MAG: hypothetical protein LBM68_03275 [Bacteroidales bacterium]|jgi:hypothetical protein|nr:hypothetical protein [Bacteroidales bacterium]
MATITKVPSNTTAKVGRVIQWGLPSADGVPATQEEFCAMIREAEKSESMTFEQFQGEMHEWLQNNL